MDEPSSANYPSTEHHVMHGTEDLLDEDFTPEELRQAW